MTYIIQASTNLARANWLPYATNTLPVGGFLSVTDPQSAAFSRRYYRAVKSP